MEEILHQLRAVVYPIISQGFIYPRRLFGISSVNSITGILDGADAIEVPEAVHTQHVENLNPVTPTSTPSE